jgi:ubiquinone/menaquinone biosynthesis C-methylase UbiE
MSNASVFDDSVARNYDRYLRPLFFEPYAEDVSARLEIQAGMRVLEIACGTGILTRHLLGVLPGDATLVATDVSGQMLALAQQVVSPDERLAWQPADAMQLPFDDASFDCVVCQFGLMFFPDKARGVREMRRVLRPGGQVIFSTWHSIERNPVAAMTERVLQQLFPEDPPTFFQIPHHMHDPAELVRLARDTGFAEVSVEAVTRMGRGASARDAAMGAVTGTPLAVRLAERSLAAEPIVARLTQEIAAEYGASEIEAPLSALVATGRA